MGLTVLCFLVIVTGISQGAIPNPDDYPTKTPKRNSNPRVPLPHTPRPSLPKRPAFKPTTSATTKKPRSIEREYTDNNFSPKYSEGGTKENVCKRDVYRVPMSTTVSERIPFMFVNKSKDYKSSCDALPQVQRRFCFIIRNPPPESPLFVTKVNDARHPQSNGQEGNGAFYDEGETPCDNIVFKPMKSMTSFGYFYAMRPLCPTVHSYCKFHLQWSNLSSEVKFIIYADENIECPENAINVTETGKVVTCHPSKPEVKRNCVNVFPYYFQYHISGPDDDKFFVLGKKVFLRADIEGGRYTASLNVRRALTYSVPDSHGSSLKMWAFYERSETRECVGTRVESRVEFGGPPRTVTLACVHGCGEERGVRWFFTVGQTDIPLKQFDDIQIITLRNVTRENSTYYHCRVYDLNSTSSTSTNSSNNLKIFLDVPERYPISVTRSLEITRTKYIDNIVGELRESPYHYLAMELYIEAIVRKGHDGVAQLQKLEIDTDSRPLAVVLLGVFTFWSQPKKPSWPPMYLTFPGQFLTARDYLSGKLQKIAIGQKPTREGERASIFCQFVSCVEHRTRQSFIWRLGDQIIDTVSNTSSFKMTHKVRTGLRQFLCTFDVVDVFLNITNFKREYLGVFKCEMKVAYAKRFLPWVVQGQLNTTAAIRLPLQVSVYPKKVSVLPGSSVNFTCKTNNDRVILGISWRVTPLADTDSHEDFYPLVESDVVNSRKVVLADVSKSVTCTIRDQDGNVTTSKQAELEVTTSVVCEGIVDIRGVHWPSTKAGSVAEVLCPSGYRGFASNLCNENGVWQLASYEYCLRVDLEEAKEKTLLLRDGLLPTANLVNSVATNTLNSLSNTPPQYPEDISNVIEMVNSLSQNVNKADERSGRTVGSLVDTKSLEKFAQITDTLLSADAEIWENLQRGEENKRRNKSDDLASSETKLLASIDSLSKSSLREWRFYDTSPIVKENIVIKRDRLQSHESISFPSKTDRKFYANHDEWVLKSNTTAFLPAAAFASFHQNKDIRYSVIVYKNLEKVFNNTLEISNEMDIAQAQIVSEVLSFTVNVDVKELSSDLKLEFVPSVNTYINPTCAYLDISNANKMLWSSEMCKSEEDGTGRVICSCKHLTNFAILMGSKTSHNYKALAIISKIGCGLSIIFLLLTLIVYGITWSHVKGERSVLHVCLSASLVVFYITYLFGIEQTGHGTACLVTTILLHYFIVLVFSIMLTEGIQLYIRIKVIFYRKSLGWKLFVPPFVVAALIVAITIGATGVHGYRSDRYCWLSMESGSLWSFIGTVVCVFVVNLVISIAVLRAMLSTHMSMRQETKQRAQSALKAIFILTPILGLTWILGVISLIDNHVVFQYLFAIFNTLQGVFIFICHCLMSKLVRDALIIRRQVFMSRYWSTNSTSQNRGTTDSNRLEPLTKE